MAQKNKISQDLDKSRYTVYFCSPAVVAQGKHCHFLPQRLAVPQPPVTLQLLQFQLMMRWMSLWEQWAGLFWRQLQLHLLLCQPESILHRHQVSHPPGQNNIIHY